MDERKNFAVDIIDQKLLEKNKEEEHLTQSCEELRAKVKTVAKQKCELYKELMKSFSAYPSGKIITKHILDETISRCETLSRDVLNKPKVTTLEEPIFPTAQDEFTMMSYNDLLNETGKLKGENEQLKQELRALVQQCKNEDQIADKKFKEITEETKHLSQYLFEMKQEQQKLEYGFDQANENKADSVAEFFPEEYAADLTMSGLEDKIIEMNEKVADESLRFL